MGEGVKPSFEMKSMKVPTMVARIRWGTSRPHRVNSLSKALTEAVDSLARDTEIESLIKEIGLDIAPTTVYGKCNPAIRWEKDLWSVNEKTLAKLMLYAGNLDTLYSDRGPYSSIPFRTISTRNNPQEDFEKTRIHTFLASQKGMNWLMDLNKNQLNAIRKGEMDMCFAERLSELSTGVGFSFKPDSHVSESRGDMKLFYFFALPNSSADTLIKSIQQQPDLPYKLIRALFPTAFAPAASESALRTAWHNNGLQVLESLGDDRQYLYSYTGYRDLPQGSITPANAVDLLTHHEDEMVKNALASVTMGRYGAQTKLAVVDLRGTDEYTYSQTTGQPSTFDKATQVFSVA